MELTDKQRRFVAEYLLDYNATRAAIRAGYSESTAAEQGARLLRNVKVQTALKEANTQKADELNITRNRILRELAVIGFSDIDDYAIGESDNVSLEGFAPRNAKRAIGSIKRRRIIKRFKDEEVETIEVEFRLWDKIKALTKLGEHLQLFKDDNAETDLEPLKQLFEKLNATKPETEDDV